jgi:hypothetical protein
VKHTLTQDPALGFTAGDINGVETAFLFACVLLLCRLLPLVKPGGGMVARAFRASHNSMSLIAGFGVCGVPSWWGGRVSWRPVAGTGPKVLGLHPLPLAGTPWVSLRPGTST